MKTLTGGSVAYSMTTKFRSELKGESQDRLAQQTLLEIQIISRNIGITKIIK